jgi:orotate phosphoribosyltransferase
MSVDLGKLLETSGAILRGHFLLTSGRHSDVYFEKFRILKSSPTFSAPSAPRSRSTSKIKVSNW